MQTNMGNNDRHFGAARKQRKSFWEQGNPRTLGISGFIDGEQAWG